MSQITSSIGLISGINSADIIDQLIAIERRPINNLQNRNATLQAQQTALQEINAQLLNLLGSSRGFTTEQQFQATTASSSNEAVLTATSNTTAVPGNYSFIVKQLVSGQQTVTRGFADRDTTAVGATTLSFDRVESRLDSRTELAQLNGGEGVQRGLIRVTDRSGATAIVDLSTAITVDDVIESINAATGVSVFASAEGDALVLEDASGATATNLAVADVGLSTTASDLGLAGTSGTGVLAGTQVNRVGLDTALARLNDGAGVEIRPAPVTADDDDAPSPFKDFSLTVSDGAEYEITLAGDVTLGDVVDTINDQTGGAVTASINPAGTGLRLVDNTGSAGIAVTELESTAATDLGLVTATQAGDTLTGSRVIAGINSKLLRNLNGGSGVDAGGIDVTNSAGGATTIDLSAARSVSEVLDAINDANAGVTASLNDSGNGITLTDTAGGAGDLVVAENGATTTAADLGLLGTFADGEASSGNLQLRYVTFNSSLEDLGVASGRFLVRDATGVSATVDLTQGESTIGEVIREINGATNALGVQVTAQINATGDGVELIDTSDGTGSPIRVESIEGTTAADLGLLQTAANPGDSINGSFERTVEIDDDDTLDDVVTKINDAGLAAAAGVINAGSAGNPFRLSLTSREAGTTGGFVFDDGGLDLGAVNFGEARDAVVFFGGSDPANALALTSTTNRLDGVITGVDIDLRSTSDAPVQVTVSQDLESITSAVSGFVTAFNGLVDSINRHDSFNSDTLERGLLLGDSTVASVRTSVYNAVINPNADLPGQFRSLSQVGLTVGSGARLRFDQERFLEAFAEDPSAVEELFTLTETIEGDDGETTTLARGIGVEIEELLEGLTDAEGAVQRRVDALESQVELNNDRIDQLEVLVASRRERLEREFVGLELALAQIQDQQAALGQLSQIAASTQAQASSGG